VGKNKKKQISHSDRFTEFHCATFATRQLEKNVTNLPLEKFTNLTMRI